MLFETDILSHQSVLRRYAFSLSRSDSHADDLVQETLMKALSNKDKFESGTNLRAWLFTILRNEFYSQARKNRMVSDPDGIYAEHMTEAPSQDILIQWKEFQKHFDTLSKDQQQTIQLIAIDGMSYEEAGEVMGVPSGTVKSRMSRARNHLSSLMSLMEPDAISIGVMIRNDNFRYSDR